MLSERIRNHLLPDKKVISTEATIEKEAIVNLTSKLSEDGIVTMPLNNYGFCPGKEPCPIG